MQRNPLDRCFQVSSCELFPTWDTGSSVGASGQLFGSKTIELWPELDPHLSPSRRKAALTASSQFNCNLKTTTKRPATDTRHLENLPPSDVDMAVGLNAPQVLIDNEIRLEEDQKSMPIYRDCFEFQLLDGVAAIHEIPSEEVTYDWIHVQSGEDSEITSEQHKFGDMDKILLLIANEN